MSFVKTLATLAVGFAAAKGLEKYRDMGGAAGLQKMMGSMGGAAGGAGGLGGALGQMAGQMGIPGGAKALEDLMSQFSGAVADGTGAAQAGLGGLMSALTGGAAAAAGTAATGADAMGGLFGALTGSHAVTDTAEAHAKLMIRAMIQAAKCDGEIDTDEQARIMAHLKDADAEEIAFVKAELAAPLDIMGLAADTDAAVKAQVYSAALMAIRVDSAAETDYLGKLATALGIDPAQRDQMHRAMGVAPLGA